MKPFHLNDKATPPDQPAADTKSALQTNVLETHVKDKIISDLQRRLDDLTRLVSDWVWETDVFFRLTQVSPRVQELLNVHESTFVGHCLDDIGTFLDKDGNPFHLDWRSPFRNVLFRTMDASGGEHFFLVSGLPIYNPMNENFIGVRGTAEDITERRQTEHRLRTALEQKEALLREVHHRVKNNMQVVNSLLRLQSRQIDNVSVREAFDDCSNRIRAMSLIHEILYKSDNIAQIDLRRYVTNLVESLWNVFEVSSQRVQCSIHVEQVSLDIDRAVTVGLILNELVSNAFKHAFPDARRGKVDVSVIHGGDEAIVLRVEDDGIGCSTSLGDQSRGLGLRLIKVLSEDQLDGHVTLDNGPGTRITVTFQRLSGGTRGRKRL